MASPQASYRPAPGSIPTEPGVYTFRDANNTVIYVGKAKNLRARLANYFQDLEQLHPRTRIMVTTATQVTWTVVSSEVEALNLEYTWIKKYNPRFNVMYKDDKSYPSLAVTVKERFPRVFVYRGPQKPGVRYFGPYPKAWAIRETLDSLTKVFPVRTCTTGVFNRHAALGRPCLLGYIDKCSAPCVGNISAEDHRELVQQFMSFLGGNTASVTRNVRLEMEAAAEDLDFERAAMLRDQLSAMEKAMEKQAVVFSDSTDADVIACVADELEIAVQMFHVRRGRIHGQRGWVLEKDDRSLTETVLHLLTQFYGDQHVLQQRAQQADTALAESRAVTVIPREVLIPNELDDTHEAEEISVFQHWLTQLRGATVDVRVPQRGDKRALMETLTTNASQALARHKLQRSTDLSARSAALQELQEALGMTVSPLRIECIDISHTQGTDVVGSLVVFEDGLAKKSDYRRFHIREAVDHGRSDDVASIAEVVRRRFAHSKDRSSDHAPADPASPEVSRRFAYPPQLLLIDGGQPQVRAAAKVLEELGIDDVFVAGIAKRLEELWLPHDEYPVIIARNSPALYLVQQVRDEAHRFAITFHRQQRSKRMTHSALDDIAGLGPARRKALIAHFGSVAAVSQASIEEISKLPGFGPKLAAAVVEALNTD